MENAENRVVFWGGVEESKGPRVALELQGKIISGLAEDGGLGMCFRSSEFLMLRLQ